MIDIVMATADVPADLAQFFEQVPDSVASDVWRITPKPLKAAHFATFPPALAERCIKAGSAVGDVVLDPFFGAGTTALAAPDRHCVGIDINAAYADIASARLTAAGMTVTVEQPHQPATTLEAAE